MSDQHHAEHEHHLVPVKYYVLTFLALLFFTVITVTASQIHLAPSTGIMVALGIAVIKVLLVLSIFMGLKWDKGFNALIMLVTFVFLGIFVFFVLADEMTRGGADPMERGHFNLISPVRRPGTGEHHAE